jgi:hypothetical protein
VVENSGSYTYLDTKRAILPNITIPTCNVCNATEILATNYTFETVNAITKANCSEYNDWKMGLDSGNVYLDMRSMYPFWEGERPKERIEVRG